MILRDRYDGTDAPFEGERELLLRHLPADARVVRARATVTPVNAGGAADPFAETIRFRGNLGDWGTTKTAAPGWVEVDFHARRTLAGVQGSNLNNAGLLIDLGGIFVRPNQDGTLGPPADPAVVGDAAGLPSLTATRFRLVAAPPLAMDVSAVRVRSAPANVTLALRGQPTFWFHTGELTRPETTPDFGLLLQSYLDDTAEVVDGVFLVPFILYSDAIARLAVEVEIEYLRRAHVLPGEVRDAVLPFDHGSLPKTGGLRVALPADARVVAGAGRASGAFGGDHIAFGPTGEVASLGALPVAAGSSPAHPVFLPVAVEAVAIDLLLAATSRTARLQLDLRQDLDGKPAGESFLPAPVPFALDREMAGTPTWLSVPLPAPFQFRPGQERTYWMVLQSLEGEAAWSVEAAAPALRPMQLTQDGGFSWRQAALPGTSDRLAGLFRLRYRTATFQMPVELLVGSGPTARRVGFSRFNAQGRLDLSLDLLEISAAFNEALSESPGRCPASEHLANGDFERWSRIGNRLGEPHAIRLSAQTSQGRIAASPDGRWAYVASPSLFQAVDLDLGTTEQIAGLEPGAVVGLAVAPDGRRAYVGLSNAALFANASPTVPALERIQIIDLVSRSASGAALRLSSSPSARLRSIALSADGRRLYAALAIAGDAQLLALDPDLLQEAALRGDADAAAARLREGSISVADPADLAVSPDGARLYVLASSQEQEQVLIVEERSLEAQHGLSVSLDAELGESQRMALSADGARAVVVHDGGTSLVDLAGRRVLSSFPDRISVVAAAVEPDGSRAFLAGAEGFGALDLVRRADLPDPVPGLAPQAFDVAVTPTGDRVLLADLQARLGTDDPGPGLTVIPVGDALPAGWAVTAGLVRRSALAGSLGRLAFLGLLPEEAFESKGVQGPHAISQVVPAAPCGYELSFQGFATEDDAVAEVLWYGDDCGLLRRDSLPIATIDPESGEPYFVLHRAHLAAPEGTVQAEVRFTAPAGVAAVNDVSLRATAAALRNRDLRAGDRRGGGLPEGWTQVPEDAAGFTVLPDGEVVRLRNLGLREAALRQELAVTAGRPFALELAGRTVPAAAPPPRIELRWLAASGTEAAPPAVFEVQPDGFDALAAHGVVPAGTDRSELRLAIPAGATLEVRRIDLAFAEPSEVPVTFVAQSPGELAVQGWELEFDQVAVPPPPVPAGGLCAPTPPPGAPAAEGCCGCAKSGGHEAEAAPQGGQAPAALVRRQPMAAAPVRVLRVRELLPAARAERAEAAPITAVRGIGRGRARELEAVGIRTLRELASASPVVLRQALRGVSEAQAAGLILRARESLRQGG